MPAAIDPIIKQRVIAQYLQGVSRDTIAADNGIGAGTVSNIIDEWKKSVQDSDYESIRKLSVFCKKQGITLNALTSCIRLNNYIQSLGANANESALESMIANLANYPDRDPAKLIDAAAQISESDIPLEKLEEHVKALIAEKETLQNRLQQQIFMSNMIIATRQQTFASLMRLQALGVTDMEIKNMARLMDFDSILSLKEKNSGSTNNNGWPKF
jgi:hypothetical protein